MAGAKLVIVMGHTRCGAVTAAMQSICSTTKSVFDNGSTNLAMIVDDLRKSIDAETCVNLEQRTPDELVALTDAVSRKNVARVVGAIQTESPTLAGLVREGRIAIVGAMYDVRNGTLELLPDATAGTLTVPAVSS